MKQLNGIKQWFFKLVDCHPFNGVFIKVNQDCEWMPNGDIEISDRRPYYYHVE